MTPATDSPLFSNKRIAIATDFLESSRLALDYAIGFAHHYGASVLMVHAIELTQAAQEAEMMSGRASMLRRSADERIQALAAGVRRLGISVETLIAEGNPCDVLLEAVDKYKPDLLVLGTHGIHRGLDHLFLGSNTERIFLASCCPTLTAGHHVLGGVDLDLRFKEILYVSDLSLEAAAAAPFALMIGKDFNAWVDVCQIVPDGVKDDPALHERLAIAYCERIKNTLPEDAHRWSSAAFQLDRSLTKEQVLDRARSESAGLIVLGVKRQSHWGQHLHTSFAYQLLAEAVCPILTVHCP